MGDIMDLDLFMNIYIIFWLFILGSVMGSFLDCMAYRYVNGQSFVKGRSHCDKCGHVLSAKDLIPIFSFLVFKGKCVYCNNNIPKECFWSEFFTAIIFCAIGLKIGISLELVMYIILCCFLVVITIIDWKIYIIPDMAVFAIIVNRLVFFIFQEGFSIERFLNILLGACSVSVPLLIISLIMDYILKKETMGGGDIKLLFAIGMYMTWPEMIFLIFTACVIALIYFFFATKKEIKSEIPFGPFLSCAWILVFLYGEFFIQWYISLLF